MVDETAREPVAIPERKRESQQRDRAELGRLVELELDRWIKHRRELLRKRRRRAKWNQTGGAQQGGAGGG